MALIDRQAFADMLRIANQGACIFNRQDDFFFLTAPRAIACSPRWVSQKNSESLLDVKNLASLKQQLMTKSNLTIASMKNKIKTAFSYSQWAETSTTITSLFIFSMRRKHLKGNGKRFNVLTKALLSAVYFSLEKPTRYMVVPCILQIQQNKWWCLLKSLICVCKGAFTPPGISWNNWSKEQEHGFTFSSCCNTLWWASKLGLPLFLLDKEVFLDCS